MTKHFFWSLEDVMEEAETERKDVGYNLHVYKLMCEHMNEHGYKVPREAALPKVVGEIISQYEEAKKTYSGKLTIKERKELRSVMEFMTEKLREITAIIEELHAIIHKAWVNNFCEDPSLL